MSLADALTNCIVEAYPADMIPWITRAQHHDATHYVVANMQPETIRRIDRYDAASRVQALLRAREEHERTFIREQMSVLYSAEVNEIVSEWYYTVHDRYLGGRAPSLSPYTTSETATEEETTTSGEPSPPPPPRPRQPRSSPPPRPPRSPARPPPSPRPPPTHGMSLRRRQ
jgi:hypothetical protein